MFKKISFQDGWCQQKLILLVAASNSLPELLMAGTSTFGLKSQLWALFCLWHDTCYLIYAAAVPSNGQLSGNRRESIFPRGSPNSYISDILLEYWADHSAMSTENISKECQEAKDILENGWIVHPRSIIIIFCTFLSAISGWTCCLMSFSPVNSIWKG